MTQTLDPDALASDEAFGSPTLTLTLQLLLPDAVASAAAFGSPTVTATLQTVTPSAVASAEAFGSPTVTATGQTVLPGPIASAEVFGSPNIITTQIVMPNAVASAAAFGSPVVALLQQTMLPASVVSAEAFGSPTVTATGQTVLPASVASASAFGSPSVILSQTVFPSSVASVEAVGAPDVTLLQQTVLPASVASTEAFGSPVVSATLQIVLPAAIASAEAFGAPTAVLLQQTVLPASIVSAEAFGAPDISLTLQTVLPTSVASAEAFGVPVIGLPQVVLPTSVASAAAFGSPTVVLVDLIIQPAPIASAATIGVPAIGTSQIVQPASIASEEAFGLPFVEDAGAVYALSGTRGDLSGKTTLLLSGVVLDMTACNDNFSDGVVDPSLWTLLDVGGLTTELGVINTLSLDTGSVAGSVAGVRSVDTPLVFDVEAAFAVQALSLPAGGIARVGSLTLFVSAGNELRLDLEADRLGTTILRVYATVGGLVTVNQFLNVGTAVVSVTTLRLIRSASRVLVFLNDRLIVDVSWLSGPAHYSLTASNSSVYTSRVQTWVTSFLRRPAIMVGDEPVRTFSLLTARQVGANVPATDRPKTVDVLVYGCTAVGSIVNGFTYIAEDRLIVGRSSRATLTVLNDNVLKGS